MDRRDKRVLKYDAHEDKDGLTMIDEERYHQEAGQDGGMDFLLFFN